MIINFFEEFPNDNNLEKLKQVDFNTTVYVAAKSISEFNVIKKSISIINPEVEVAYWPILEKSYWISPFSYNDELNELYSDLSSRKDSKRLKILLDLELPIIHPKLFFYNIFSFFRNRMAIKKIFTDSERLNIDILSAEYPVSGIISQMILRCLGISYPLAKYHHKKITMFYSSMIRSRCIRRMMKRYISRQSQKIGSDIQVGLGTIAKGILGNEPILNPKDLEKDLSFCKDNNVGSVVIFRLGGIDDKYLKVIGKYSR